MWCIARDTKSPGTKQHGKGSGLNSLVDIGSLFHAACSVHLLDSLKKYQDYWSGLCTLKKCQVAHLKKTTTRVLSAQYNPCWHLIQLAFPFS